MSFTNVEWGKAVISPNYSDESFPSESILETHNSPDFKKNVFVNLHYILYFTYKYKKYSLCYYEAFLDKKSSGFTNQIVLELTEDGYWLMTDYYHFRGLRNLTKLKLKYALNLLQGKRMIGNKKFNELLELTYKDGVLDFYKISILQKKKDEYFYELLEF